MADALWMKVREVDWEKFPTSDGTKVPSLIRNLASRKLARAMKASQQAWVAYCGGGQIHPAAVPSIPFLVEVMAISDEGVQEGILDILVAIVADGGEGLQMVKGQLDTLKKYRRSKDNAVATKVSDLLAKF